MVPNLSPLSGVSTGPVQVPPPPGFRGVHGQVREVHLQNPRTESLGTSAAQRNGLRYERAVHKHLAQIFDSDYIRSPVFRFRDFSGYRFCVPDGVATIEDDTWVFEIKYSHMPEAWWQLRKLYEPVVRAWRPLGEVGVVEICRTYDPATPFPEAIDLIDNLAARQVSERFGVYRWKK